MSKDEISVDSFSLDVSAEPEYIVDINFLLGVCGASPVRMHFKTDKIIVVNTYPEVILLASGDNYINISQIQKIRKRTTKNGKISYEIVCGVLKELETTVKISQT